MQIVPHPLLCCGSLSQSLDRERCWRRNVAMAVNGRLHGCDLSLSLSSLVAPDHHHDSWYFTRDLLWLFHAGIIRWYFIRDLLCPFHAGIIRAAAKKGSQVARASTPPALTRRTARCVFQLCSHFGSHARWRLGNSYSAR